MVHSSAWEEYDTLPPLTEGEGDKEEYKDEDEEEEEEEEQEQEEEQEEEENEEWATWLDWALLQAKISERILVSKKIRLSGLALSPVSHVTDQILMWYATKK